MTNEEIYRTLLTIRSTCFKKKCSECKYYIASQEQCLFTDIPVKWDVDWLKENEDK